MTKEELIERSYETNSLTTVIKLSDVEEFFSQNVVIPKGENRHKFADELHHLVEGYEIQYLLANGSWSTLKTDTVFLCDEYRIKPEPVYEWQWYININGKLFKTDDHMTEDEFNKTTHFIGKRIESTKRVRQ